MATPPPHLRRIAALLLVVLAGLLASTARADLVISKADRRVSTVLAAQISEPSSRLSPASALSDLTVSRVFASLSSQVDLTSHIVRVLASLKVCCLALSLSCFYESFLPAQLRVS